MIGFATIRQFATAAALLTIAIDIGLATEAAAQTSSWRFDDCDNHYFALRTDFNDLGPYLCPASDNPAYRAQGASASFAYNALTRQDSVAIDGLAAAGFLYPGNLGGPNPFIGLSAAVFVQTDGMYVFQPTPGQGPTSDTITSGAFTQVNFTDPFFRGAQDAFRFRGGQVDGSNGIYYTTFVGEWFPVYSKALGGPANFGTESQEGKVLRYVFSPELMMQYDQLEGGPNKYALFASRHEDLRIGPQAALQIWAENSNLPVGLPAPLASFLGNTSALITYHVAWDSYTGRNFSYAAASVTYTFPAFGGHLGVSAAYAYGDSETTGNLTNQVKLGLSGKF
jgi:hypothetical protein